MEQPWFFFGLLLVGLFSLRMYAGFIRRLSTAHGEGDIVTAPYKLADSIFAAALGIFFLFISFSAGDGPHFVNRQVLLNSSLFFLCIITAILTFLVLRQINPVEVFGLSASRPAAKIGNGLLWLLAAYPLILLAQGLSYSFFPAETEAQPIIVFLAGESEFLDQLLVILMAVIMAPLAEELIFRGYLYGVIRKAGGRWSAVATTSLLFAGIHMHPPSFFGLFLLGVILALLYEKSRCLWVPIVMHAVFNAVSVSGALFWPELAQ